MRARGLKEREGGALADSTDAAGQSSRVRHRGRLDYGMHYGSGMMGGYGYGIWSVVGGLLVVFLVVALVRKLNKT
jgi:hypothetical protein